MCPHGISNPLLPSVILSQQTVQEGTSILPFDKSVLFLQCFSSILTIGRFFTTSSLAFLVLGYELPLKISVILKI
jgi:hypothetical protein